MHDSGLSMRFSRVNGGVVEITDRALASMQRHVQNNSEDAEAGGVLLGRLVACTQDVVIDEVTEPVAEDRRGRFFFWRSKPAAQRRVDDVWAASRGTRNYLGEWHTHPEDAPFPSQVDQSDWAKIVRSARYEQDFLLFVIVGRTQTRVWEVKKSGATPIEAVRIRRMDRRY